MAAGRLAGEIAVVTAAGQGLGEAIAKTYAREGASVAAFLKQFAASN